MEEAGRIIRSPESGIDLMRETEVPNNGSYNIAGSINGMSPDYTAYLL